MGHSPLRVALVDDDDDLRAMVALSLKLSHGCALLSCASAEQALRELPAFRPDVIVLDYMMPRFSGAQFRARQLANPETSDVPVILVSAVADLESHADALRPFAVLQKPIDPDQLVSLVRQASASYLGRHAPRG